MRCEGLAISTHIVLSACLLLPLGQASATPITHFSSARVLSYGSAVDEFQEVFVNENPLYVQHNSSTTGTTVNADLTYTGTEGTAEAHSEAALSGGVLKVKADATSLDNSDPFTINAHAFARADIGDSFRTFDSQGAFQWTSATEVTFSIDFSGTSQAGPNVNDRADVGFFLVAFTPGYLDTYAQWLLNDAMFPSDYIANRLFVADYHLGGTLYNFQIPVGPLPATIDVTFAPGGDFDWVAGITADAAASVLGTSVIDFFSTATMSYAGPEGTTTYSASGVFPGTTAAPTAGVPEPHILALLVVALAGMRYRQAKRRSPE